MYVSLNSIQRNMYTNNCISNYDRISMVYIEDTKVGKTCCTCYLL